MTPNATDLKIIASWLASLMNLTAHPHGPPTKDAIALYASLLGEEFPAGAFTPSSLSWVSRDLEYWPALAPLRDEVRIWWNDNRPRTAPAITDQRQEPVGWKAMDGHWRAFWYRRLPEITNLARQDKRDEARANLESLIRTQSPLAWQTIQG